MNTSEQASRGRRVWTVVTLLVTVMAPVFAGATVAGAHAAGVEMRDAGQLRAEDLRCEYLKEPLGVGERLPRLSWIVTSQKRGEVQTAYRVLVASSVEMLARGEGDLWDSGKVPSSATAQVVYGGSALGSRQTCFWKVKSWDGEGREGEWSAGARWEMGLLEPADWSAKWVDAGAGARSVKIVHAEYGTADGKVAKDVTEAVRSMAERGAVVASNGTLGGDPARDVRKRLLIEYEVNGIPMRTEVAEHATADFSTIPLLRRGFEVKQGVASARLFGTALGVYELSINGKRVGDHELAPGWTDYRQRVRYQTFDVTDLVKPGANMIGAIVGPGWFSGRAGLFFAKRFYGQTPALLVQLEITYTDGSVERVCSDGSWHQHDGPIVSSDLMDGEVYDSRGELPGWDLPGAGEEGWSLAATREEKRNLEATIDRPMRALLELPAKSVTEPLAGKWTFDLGQNMVGVVKLRVRGKAGTLLTIRHGELLNPDGTIYTANLRGAPATDTYICRGGDKEEEWRPRFTFHGFRYVEVTGLSEKPGIGAITGIVLGSDLERAGTFECSDASLNQLQSNIEWGQRGNYLSIPTDCPQRDERMGWMADTQVFVPTAAFNTDIAPFMSKWMVDVDDAQREDGAYADVSPVMKGLNFGTPAWADAGTIVPWAVYQQYGDTRVLERHIGGMVRWVEWCREHSNGLIRDCDRGNDYGDWLAIGADTPKDLIGTAYFARSTWIVAQSLRVLGRVEEAEKYDRLFGEISAAFNVKWVRPDEGVQATTQCADVLALHFGLLPEAMRVVVADRLVADVESKGWHLSTGFVGVSMLLPVLSASGRDSVAYRLLMQDTFPSWLYSVRQGATTIWERWDGATEAGPHPDIGMNSFNHYALGSCGEWLYRGVGGIEPDRPGFGHVVIRPRLEGPLTWAKTSYRSIRGEFATDWRLEGDSLVLKVNIPANASARVYVPCAGDDLRESGRPATQSEGVRVVEHDGGTWVLDVGSGSYEFSSRIVHAGWGNPVITGWYADPEAAAFAGTYWIYPTTSAPYDQQTSFDAFSSSDLVHWTKHPRVLDSRAVSWAKRAMWAPSVVENRGKYYFFFGANDIQNDQQLGGIGVAVGDSPAGPFNDLLGKPLVDTFHNGAQPIDQFAFHDEGAAGGAGGRPRGWYLIFGGWRHCNVAKLREDFKGLEPFDDGTTFKEITPEGYVEGPFMFVRNGRYYFMWSEGGWTGPDYSVAYAIGDSPTGPFKRVGKILQQDPKVATGAGHHSVLRGAGNDEYFIVYHRRPLRETDGNHRVVCIDRMNFDGEGKIVPVKMTFEGVVPGTR